MSDATTKPEPLDQLSSVLYDALREHARRLIGGGQAVDATDLVHEAYVRLARSERYEAMERAEFLALTATVIRRLFIDEVRRGDRERLEPVRVTLSGANDLAADGEVDFLRLDAALDRLGTLDPRQARIVELRFFAGLPLEEVSTLLGVAPRTITREWGMARAWLKRELNR